MPPPPAPQAKATKTATGPPMGLIGVVIALLVVIVAVLVYLVTRTDSVDATGGVNSLPQGGGLVLNPDVGDDVPQVHIYEDFQCPFCGQLEAASGDAISEAAAAGDIRVTYTFMSFLDDSLRNDSSSRAANAAVCSADADQLSGFVTSLFARQPVQEGTEYEDQTFVDAAQEAGIEGEALDTFTSCVETSEYADYVTSMQERATEDEVTSSPVVMIDGERISDEQLAGLLDNPASFRDLIASQE